jgi:hypothetical protein
VTDVTVAFAGDLHKMRWLISALLNMALIGQVGTWAVHQAHDLPPLRGLNVLSKSSVLDLFIVLVLQVIRVDLLLADSCELTGRQH